MRTINTRTGRHGFTLIELLVVIAIIGVLAAFLLPAIARAQWNARKAKCISQLHQWAIALQAYRGTYDGHPPPWLSNMYPKTVANPKLFLCPEDPTGGQDGGKPYWEDDETRAYIETDDFDGSAAGTKDPQAAGVQNHDIKGNSYLYECCCAELSWDYTDETAADGHSPTLEEVDIVPDTIHANGGTGTVTWREIKEWSVKYIGAWTPIVRCFWHTGGTFARTDMVLNLGANTYHIYHSDTSGEGWKTAGNQ